LALNAPQAAVQLSGPANLADLRWHSVVLSWKGRQVKVTFDDAPVIAATLADSLKLPGMGHGPDIRDLRRHIEPAKISFGPIPGAVLDDLRMGIRP
jgi:hypothetical protein